MLAWWLPLMRAAAQEYGGNRLAQDRNVVAQRPVPDVPNVEFHAARIAGVIPAADLPKPGETRLRFVVVFDIPAVACHFPCHDRARSNEAHLAAQHVEQLRQLVEAGPPQEHPDFG